MGAGCGYIDELCGGVVSTSCNVLPTAEIRADHVGPLLSGTNSRSRPSVAGEQQVGSCHSALVVESIAYKIPRSTTPP